MQEADTIRCLPLNLIKGNQKELADEVLFLQNPQAFEMLIVYPTGGFDLDGYVVANEKINLRTGLDRKSVVVGKIVDIGGGRII